MSQNFRYKGVNSFTEEDKNIFFGRNSEIEEVYKNIYSERILVIYSKPGFGKTSLINAGIIPMIRQKNKAIIYNLNIKNYIKSNSENLISKLITEIEKEDIKNSYLDKVISDDNSLWIKLKKVQAKHKEPIILFLDQFENFFDYPENEIEDFKTQINTVLYSQIPEKYREEIQQKISNNTDFLTSEGFKLLYKSLEVKIVIGIRADRLSLLNSLKDSILNILKNLYELPPLNESAAIEAIIKPAIYESKYVSQNDFATNKFEYKPELINEIIHSLTNNKQKKIETYQLQIICENIERIVYQNKLEIIDKHDIGDISSLFKNYYDNLIAKIEDSEQQHFARLMIEDELILAEEERRLSIYEGVAINKCKVNKNTLNTLINNQLLKIEKNQNHEIFYELSHDALVVPILKSKNKRIETQIRLEEELKQKEKLKELVIKEQQKTIKSKKITFTILVALITTLIFAIYGIIQKNIAENNADNAKSNLMASYSFQELEKDPTLSFRLAQEAFFANKLNSNAYSALINSFYKTNIFYNILGSITTYVESACISDDGKRILFIANDDVNQKYKVILTDITGRTIIEFLHDDKISSAVFSPQQDYILTACWDSVARIWDLDGNRIQTFENHKAILNYANFSPNGEMIVTTGNDNKAMIWDLNGNKIAELVGHTLYVRTATFSPNNTMVVTASEDNSARIWDLKGNQLSICVIEEERFFYNTIIISAKFTNDNKNILLVSDAFVNTNNTARIFDLKGKELQVFRGHNDWVNFADISSDNQKIITTSRDNSAIIWDMNGKPIYKLIGHKSSVFAARLLEKENKVITVSFDGTIREWTLHDDPFIFDKNEKVEFATFSPSGIYIIGANENKIKICNLLGDSILNFEHSDIINTAYISNNYDEILTSSKDKNAIIWDFKGKIKKILKAHTDCVNTAVFSPQCDMYLTASDDKTAKLWDKDANVITTFVGHNKKINTAYFSKDGNYIITASNDSTAKLWDLEGNVIQTFKGHKDIVTSASISPDGDYVVTTGNDETARLWKITGEQALVFQGYENKVNSAEFSPDGKHIVTTSDDKTARLWDLNGHQIMVFQHEGAVKQAVFSTNGNYILSVYYTNKFEPRAKLWLIDANEICSHVDELNIFGKVWKLDEFTKKSFNL